MATKAELEAELADFKREMAQYKGERPVNPLWRIKTART